jgi:heme A synthase
VNPNLHRLAILVAVCALLLVVSGTIVFTMAADRSLEPAHKLSGEVVGTLAVVLAIWLMVAIKTTGARVLGALMVAMTAVTAVFGAMPATPNSTALHAGSAQVYLALLWAAVVVTSRGWTEDCVQVKDQGWPALRSLAMAMPVFVLIQVALGSMVRHNAGDVVLWHLAGAMIVALLILCECMFVTQPYPKHATLRPAANLLLAVTCTQVFLGIARYTVLMINKFSLTVNVISAGAHVAVGAMTLAATLGLSLQIRHNCFKAPPEAE